MEEDKKRIVNVAFKLQQDSSPLSLLLGRGIEADQKEDSNLHASPGSNPVEKKKRGKKDG